MTRRVGVVCSHQPAHASSECVSSECATRSAAFLPSMIPSKPPVFFKIVPVNPDGVTVVDLGEEMGQDLPLVMARPSSVPPSPTRAEFNHNSRVVRHGSLPPPPKGSKLPKITFPRPVEHVIEETEDELNNKDNSDSESVRMIRVTEPPGQNSKTPNAQVNPAEVS